MGKEDCYIWESVYMRFVLDTSKSRKFPKFSQDKATVDAHGMFIMNIPCLPFVYIHPMCVLCIGKHGSSYKSSAWVSALLVLLDWAMREPRSVGRVTGTDFHAFLYTCHIYIYCLIANAGRSIGIYFYSYEREEK